MHPDFLNDGGEMGALMRAYDWAGSSLGPPEAWPPSLRLTVRLVLNTRHPMFIWWGPDLIQFYNDAYRETMGPERHPSALGQRGRECWEEIWPIIGPQIDYVLAGKGSTWDEDKLVPVTRHGRRRDVWWTYSYSPIDDDGRVGGVLVVCNDVTAQHRLNQRLKNQFHRLSQLFDQAPGFIAILRGEEHRFELVNQAYQRLVGENRELVNRTVAEAVPEAAEQGFIEILDRVYRTGEAHVASRAPIDFATEGGGLRRHHLDFVYQPIIDDDGEISGIFVQGVDVTAHHEAEANLRLINAELQHRVKNTLAVVNGIARQSLRDASGDALGAFQARIAAFGRAHDALSQQTWATATVRATVSSALEAFESQGGRFEIDGPDVLLGSRQSLSLSMAVHELATNAVKYGALGEPGGVVCIRWLIEGDRFVWEWQERGGPPVREPARVGYGSQLVKRVLAADFNGAVEVRFDAAGARYRLEAPLDAIHPPSLAAPMWPYRR